MVSGVWKFGEVDRIQCSFPVMCCIMRSKVESQTVLVFAVCSIDLYSLPAFSLRPVLVICIRAFSILLLPTPNFREHLFNIDSGHIL